MKRRWLMLIAPPAIALFVWVFGEIVMHLWNWLLPMLFGWQQITFWQALGLLVLCRILFGGWGGGSRGPKHKKHLSDRWEKMTPEEREKFRRGMRGRCGGFGPPPADSKEPA